MQEKEMKIVTTGIVDIDISGKKGNIDKMRARLSAIKKTISDHHGRVLLEKEFPDGFHLMVSFTETEDEQMFRIETGLIK